MAEQSFKNHVKFVPLCLREPGDQATLGLARPQGQRLRTSLMFPTLYPRWPKLIQFLGYDPRPAPVGLGPALVRWRKGRAMSQKELAARLGVDPSTLARWERGERLPTGRFLGRVREVLDSTPESRFGPAIWTT